MITLAGLVLIAAGLGVWLLVLRLWRNRRFRLATLALVALVIFAYHPLIRSLTMLAAVGLGVWRYVHPDSFRRLVGAPVWRLRRRGQLKRAWPHLMATHGLSWERHPKYRQNVTTGVVRIRQPKPVIPKLEKIIISPSVDRLQVRLLSGQTPADWSAQAEALAHAFGVRSALVRASGPGRIVLDLYRTDTLSKLVAPFPVTSGVNLKSVPVGVREDGQAWTLATLGAHTLIAGCMGAGKGSVIWSLIQGLADPISTGLVQLWVIDPKGGMELGPGARLFSRFVTTAEDACRLVEDAAELLTKRAERLRGVTRSHTPTVDEPLVVVLVDEIAFLTAYQPDRKLKERFTAALNVCLSQGRAVGVSVVAALQDPRREVLPNRNLFSARVALRLDSESETDMVLGENARRLGASCELIPESTPGVAYVVLDGVREPVRVRASYITDADIAHLVENYSAPVVSSSGCCEW